MEEVIVADGGAGDDVGIHIGAAEAIDRLLGITDQEQCARTQGASRLIHSGRRACFPAQEPDDLDLQWVSVLELIDQNMAEVLPKRLAYLFVPREQVARRVEQVVEIEERSEAFVNAPVLHQLVHLGGDPRKQLGRDR